MSTYYLLLYYCIRCQIKCSAFTSATENAPINIRRARSIYICSETDYVVNMMGVHCTVNAFYVVLQPLLSKRCEIQVLFPLQSSNGI